MNKTLAARAMLAVKDADFEDEDGYCQRFNRQIIQSVYGDKYDQFHKASAKESAEAWLAAGIGVRSSDPSKLEEGDVVYKTTGSGPYGHVGIVTSKGIAENSSTSIGRVRGAKGYRSVAEFGHFDVVVRLPDPKAAQPEPPKPKQPIFLINNRIIEGARLENGQLVGPVVDVLDSVGFEVEKVNDRRAERGRLDVRAVPSK